MTNDQPLKIGNAQAFWGDSPSAPAALLSQSPDLDVLTLDYLAEVSMSILAKQRQRDPSAGYARDFLNVLESLAPHWRSGRPPPHFNCPPPDSDRLAGATIAGHLIECGTQVTGGISTDWLDLPNPSDLGYPNVEVSADGSCVVTKPAHTGGRVDERTVK